MFPPSAASQDEHDVRQWDLALYIIKGEHINFFLWCDSYVPSLFSHAEIPVLVRMILHVPCTKIFFLFFLVHVCMCV